MSCLRCCGKGTWAGAPCPVCQVKGVPEHVKKGQGREWMGNAYYGMGGTRVKESLAGKQSHVEKLKYQDLGDLQTIGHDTDFYT
jgi:hypothetical protein